MSAESHRSSHGASWVLGIVGAQVFYVLGAGPVEYWQVKNALGGGEDEGTSVERCGGRQRHTRYAKSGASVGDVRISYGSS